MSRQYIALSGLAMVLIVLHHSIDMHVTWLHNQGLGVAQEWQNLLLVVLHRLGKAAVPLFLFISGSFIAYAARGNPPKLSWHTAKASITRLLWPYLVWSAVFYFLIYVQFDIVFSPAGYIKNLLTGYPYHFVPLLLFFYAISPLLAPASKRFGWLLVALIGAFQLVLIPIEFPGTFGVYPPNWAQVLSPPILGHTLAMWAIYFPLGLVVGLNMKRVKPWLQRTVWAIVLVACVFFVLDVLDTAAIIDFPAAVNIYPLAVVLLAPLVPRNSIPGVKYLETVGKSTYGVYLTHLVVIDLVLLVIYQYAPSLAALPLLTVVIVFTCALAIPLAVMALAATGRTRTTYRYVFG